MKHYRAFFPLRPLPECVSIYVSVNLKNVKLKRPPNPEGKVKCCRVLFHCYLYHFRRFATCRAQTLNSRFNFINEGSRLKATLYRILHFIAFCAICYPMLRCYCKFKKSHHVALRVSKSLQPS